MSDRLVLNTVGIKDPSASGGDASDHGAQPPAGQLELVRDGGDTSPRGRRVLTPTPVIPEGSETVAELITTVRLDEQLAIKLQSTARAAGVTPNGLAVAALERALATEPGLMSAHEPRSHSRRRMLSDALRRALPDDPRAVLALAIVAATALRVSTR